MNSIPSSEPENKGSSSDQSKKDELVTKTTSFGGRDFKVQENKKEDISIKPEDSQKSIEKRPSVLEKKVESLKEKQETSATKNTADTIDEIKSSLLGTSQKTKKIQDPKQEAKNFISSLLIKEPRISAESPEYQVKKPSQAQQQPEQKINVYSDQYHLLSSPQEIKEENEAFYMNQAALFVNEKDVSPEMKQKLYLLAVHGLAKTATIADHQAKSLGIQISPFVPQDKSIRYYRSASNRLLDEVNRAYAKAMRSSENEILLIDNPKLFCETFAREKPGSHLCIKNEKEFEELIDKLLAYFDAAAEAATIQTDVMPTGVTPQPIKPEPITPMAIIPQIPRPEPITPMAIIPQIPRPEPITPIAIIPQTARPEPITPMAITPQTARPEPITPMAITPQTARPEPITPMAVTPQPITPMTAQSPIDPIPQSTVPTTAVQETKTTLIPRFEMKAAFIDITDLLNKDCSPEEIQKIVKRFVDVIKEKIKGYDTVTKEEIAKHILREFHVIGFCKYREQNILLTPSINNSLEKALQNEIDVESYLSGDYWRSHELTEMLARTGNLVNPDQIKQAWLKVVDPTDIPNMYKPALVTKFGEGKAIPTVFNSYQEFINNSVINEFQKLSKSANAPPYLKVMPEATINLLKGFQEFNVDSGGIQKFFQDNGLHDQLQLFYVGMIEIMKNAILHKDDFMAFNNNIEALHQVIQNINGIANHYDEQAFEQIAVEHFTSGKDPIVPAELNKPKAYAASSGMRGFSCVTCAVEAQKGTNALNVALQKDSYYESSGLIDHAKTYSSSTLDGDTFNGNEDAAIGQLGSKKIDMYVCEFHHNISLTRKSYSPENVTGQVLALFKKDIVNEPLTVSIDCTIGLEQSDDVRNLLNHPEIKELITSGRLNVALFRSAQKFDMLGMDNYSCGVVVTINNGKSFPIFDKHMQEKDNQLKGLSYQGMTHIQKYGNPDTYRKALMANTMKFYKMLPEESIYSPTSQSPLQISKIEDEKECFLDIKVKPQCANAFLNNFWRFAFNRKLSVSQRASFGFMTTNIVGIPTTSNEIKLRITPGLEDEKTIEQYVYFIQKTYEVMKNATKANPNISDEGLAEHINSYWKTNK